MLPSASEFEFFLIALKIALSFLISHLFNKVLIAGLSSIGNSNEQMPMGNGMVGLKTGNGNLEFMLRYFNLTLAAVMLILLS